MEFSNASGWRKNGARTQYALQRTYLPRMCLVRAHAYPNVPRCPPAAPHSIFPWGPTFFVPKNFIRGHTQQPSAFVLMATTSRHMQ
eukprot:2686724-Amphidinium_carterae.1